MSEFDAKARGWDADPAKVERAHRVAEAIAKRLPGLGRMSVLEVGCGTGLLGLALQPRVAQVTMADSSSEMLAVAREKIAALGVSNAAAMRLDLVADPVPDARFDLVCTLMTLHHIPDIDGVLAKLGDLLAPEGVLAISDLDREDGSFHGEGFAGHKGFDRGDLAARLARAGFGRVRFETVLEIERETGPGARRYPLFLALAERS